MNTEINVANIGAILYEETPIVSVGFIMWVLIYQLAYG